MPQDTNPVSLAQRVLVDYWDERTPVDPVSIALAMGIEVLQTTLAPEVSGALVRRGPGEPPRIFLQEGDANNRKRFTCAHELGHYLDRSGKGDEYEYVDLRDIESALGIRPDEIFANRFAANLLMPESTVRERFKGVPGFGTDEKIIHLAKVFGVSIEAMRFRLMNLRLVE